MLHQDRVHPGTSRRGFASMDQQRQREIASKGGKAAHLKGTAHEFTSEEARRAGQKGGEAAHKVRKARREGNGPELQEMKTHTDPVPRSDDAKLSPLFSAPEGEGSKKIA